MERRVAELERAVKKLEEIVSRQESRITTLENGVGASRSATAEMSVTATATESAPSPASDPWTVSALKGTPALVGRSLLILAGAFLLRALTEAETLATGSGVALGLAYAASWIVAAATAARKGARASAGFFGVCAAVIAGPLIFEAATEFGVMSPTGSAVTLAIMTAAGLVVASRWRLPESAWVFVVGAMVTGAALAIVRPPGEAATAVLVVVGLAGVWLAGVHRWESLRWLPAVGADIGVLRLTALATSPSGPHGFDPPPVTLVAVLQGILILGYAGSSFARAVRGKHQIRIFDYVQTGVALAVGWGGAIQLARTHEMGTRGLSLCALLVALAAYGAAFGMVEMRRGGRRSMLFLSTLGLALVLLAPPEAFKEASTVMWAGLALVASTAGSLWNKVTLRVHGALLLLAAWIVSGLAAAVVADLVGRADFSLPVLPSFDAILVAVLTVATTVVVLVTRRSEGSGWLQRLPMTGLLVLSGMVLVSAFVSVAEVLTPSFALWMGTVALSAITVASAFLASRWGLKEAGWLVYPLLALTGMRVVFADLASGRTVVFVIALAAYGAALITSPKILRSSRVD